MCKDKHRKKRKSVRKSLLTIAIFFILFFATSPSYASATSLDTGAETEVSDDTFSLNITSNAGSTNLEATLQILIILTLLAISPSLLIMITSFTRLIVVFHFLRTALGTQTTPPNQVLVGLALFMTLAIMMPVMQEVNTEAVQPYMSGQLDSDSALEAGIAPLKEFMLKQTRDKDLDLFMSINGQSTADVESFDDISIMTVIPAFIISELRTAFIIGFVIYLPFIVMDMVVAATLMSMGMMMLPPTTISLPFKILLFILADGWNLVVGQLVESFM